jgi:hypothetical protein
LALVYAFSPHNRKLLLLSMIKPRGRLFHDHNKTDPPCYPLSSMILLRAGNSGLRLFFLRIAARRGEKAYVPLARKILCITHHLLVTGEKCVKGDSVKKVRIRMRALEGFPLEEMTRILTGAGYLVDAPA